MRTVQTRNRNPEPNSRAPVVKALSYGREVELAKGSGRGRVISATRSGAYLQSAAGHVFGVVSAAAANGPLGLRISDTSPLLGISAGTPFEFSGSRLLIGNRALIVLDEATLWSPQAPRAWGDVSPRRAAARELLGIVASSGRGPTCRLLARVPEDDSLDGRLERAMRHRVEGLVEALASRDPEDTYGALVGLLGLGSGLTPAGDDLAAGVVAAAAWRSAYSPFAAALHERAGEELGASSSSKTVSISTRLLYHAARGSLYEPAVRLGARLMAGDPEGVKRSAPALLGIGGSSGSETAAGILLGLTVFGESEGEESIGRFVSSQAVSIKETIETCTGGRE